MGLIKWKSVAMMLAVCVASAPNLALGQDKGPTRDEMVLADRDSLVDDDFWIYDDLEQGFEVAARDKRPLMVVLRCIP